MNSDAPLAAISYAHGEYDDQIIALSDELRAKGVDCEIDAYEDSPPQGWLQWMEDMMTRRTVLAVCTATYAERLRNDAPPGQGRGVAWEGRLLKVRVFDEQGKNRGVVPIVFSSADLAHIPPFLKDVTYYDLSRGDGFERLYRRLTQQPAHPRPPLGTIEQLLPHRVTPHRSSVALIDIPKVGRVTADVLSLSRAAARTELKLRADAQSARYLVRLAGNYGTVIAFAYRLECYLGRVRSVSHLVENGIDLFTIAIEDIALPAAGSVTEMSYNGVAADEIAIMRARRILLNEPLPDRFRSDRLMDSFIKGSISKEGQIEVACSNIPRLDAEIGDDEEFMAVARLDSVLQLQLSATVESIEQLELRREHNRVHVDFVGHRSQIYVNREPVKIEVHGDVLV